MFKIFIDADGCAVKEETYKVAARYQLHVFVVANKPLNVPLDSMIEMKVVSGNFDAADDWIVETAQKGDIVITSDILLAERCVKKEVKVLGPKGVEWTDDNIGSSVATRELMQNLRHMGEMRGGPAPMEKKDRSNFLAKLDQIIQTLKRQLPK
ncbi:MAG: YaiI/YqxD family protein [Bdellovibrionota bacterium]